MESVPWVLPEELRQIADWGDESLVKEVLDVFRSDTAERLVKLQTALAQDDRAQVKSQAHAIKGSASQVGAKLVTSLCQQLELQATTADAAVLADFTSRLQTEFEVVCQAMLA